MGRRISLLAPCGFYLSICRAPLSAAAKQRRQNLAQLVAERLANGQETAAVCAVLFGDLEPAEAAVAYGLADKVLAKRVDAV